VKQPRKKAHVRIAGVPDMGLAVLKNGKAFDPSRFRCGKKNLPSALRGAGSAFAGIHQQVLFTSVLSFPVQICSCSITAAVP